MPESTYATQIKSQQAFYNDHSPRTAADKKKMSDQTTVLAAIVAPFNASSTSASAAGQMLQEAMNQFSILYSTAEALAVQDGKKAPENSGPLSTNTVTPEQAKEYQAFDQDYINKISLVLLTFQSNVEALAVPETTAH